MPEAIPAVLWSWVPITLLLFWRLPPARAAAASLLGGWLFLPTARFPDDLAGVEFPYWVLPACLPAGYWTTKARVVGVALVLGVAAFDPGAWRRLRPSTFDLPVLGWCLCPVASGLANGAGVAGMLADAAYLSLAWGVPYLAGRIYFADPAGLEILARGVIAGGLIYVPLCLVEGAAGPVFYRALYGFHPYQAAGSTRYVGFRPIVFLEDGNQLGTWMASSALVAAWMWRSGKIRRFWGLPGWAVAGELVAASVLTQSVGAVALLLMGLAGLEVVRLADRRWLVSAVLMLPMLFVGARAANLFDAKALAMRSAIGRKFVETSTRLDRQSFGWRLRVEERGTWLALRRPVLGWSRWDWWRASGAEERPWGLPGLVLGMQGLVGWTLLIGTLALPIAAFLSLGPARFWTSATRAPAAALAGALALNDLDAILNANLLLPFLAAAGGLVGLRLHASAASGWLRRAQAGLR